MNKTIKIFLLVVAVLLSIGGIMYYYKTVVEPPLNLKFANQYIADTKRDVAKFGGQTNGSQNDSLYVSIFDKISFFAKEGRINEKERDALIDDLANSYTPKFISTCHSRFESSIWNVSDHRKMLSRIKELKNLTISGGTQKVIQGDYLNSISEIERVIDQYNAAISLSHRTGYSGSLESAKSTIAEARQYASMKYLSNCMSLVSDLRALPEKIGASHYNYLSLQVGRLFYWEVYKNIEEYESLAQNVYNKIDEYDNNASATYGSKKSVDDLKNTAGRHLNWARNYFEDKQ